MCCRKVLGNSCFLNFLATVSLLVLAHCFYFVVSFIFNHLLANEAGKPQETPCEFFCQSLSKHWATGAQSSDFFPWTRFYCALSAQVSSKDTQPGTQAKEWHPFGCWGPFIHAALVPCSAQTGICSERCLCEREGIHTPRVPSESISHLWDGWLVCKSFWCF